MRKVTIGILALQGAFAEHETLLRSVVSLEVRVCTCLVRTSKELENCDGLIIPGGESTTIAILAKSTGLLEPLRKFTKTKPIWGTCAGAILLAENIHNPKRGGQELLNGMSLTIARNGWGPQAASFEVQMNIKGLQDAHIPFTCVFIRAPVITEIREGVDVIASLPPEVVPESKVVAHLDPRWQRAVAVRQGNRLLTTFHPELTADERFHRYFVKMCEEH